MSASSAGLNVEETARLLLAQFPEGARRDPACRDLQDRLQLGGRALGVRQIRVDGVLRFLLMP